MPIRILPAVFRPYCLVGEARVAREDGTHDKKAYWDRVFYFSARTGARSQDTAAVLHLRTH